MRANIFPILSLCLASVVISGCIIPPYPQIAPITPFSGRVVPAQEVFVFVKGHPETMNVSDKEGKFITKWGRDIYFGGHQAYAYRYYVLLFKKEGEIVGREEVTRPALVGWSRAIGKYNKTVDVGVIQLEGNNKLQAPAGKHEAHR